MSEPLRVLILDDVEADAALVEHALGRAGLSFVAFHVDHEAAFRRSLAEFQPDLVLSDYSLPGFDALGALAAVRAYDPSLPFIVVTGSLTEETAADCIKAGANDYVIKEHLARLPVAVQSALERQRVLAERSQVVQQAEREREQLLALERRQRETAETLAAANLALAQLQELPAILDTLLDYLERLVPSASSMVLLLREDDVLEVGAVRGHEKWSDSETVRRVTFDTRANRLLRDVLETRSPIVIDDTETDPRWERKPQGAHVRSWLGVPLVIQGKSIGIYSLDRTERGFFTEEHVRLAVSLAPAAATAVEMARLLRTVRDAGEFNQQIITSAQDGIIVFDRELRYQVWNRTMENLTGLAASAVLGATRTGVFLESEAQGVPALQERALAGETTTSDDLEGTSPGGGTVWVSMRFAPLRNAAGDVSGVIAIVRDITERKTVEAFRNEQNRILERIAANAPLGETLPAIARLVESACPGVLCTIVLLAEDGVHVSHGAAPSLPEAFVAAVDGQGIGPSAGSCGTAMHRREPVEVEDILVDPLWADYRELAALGGVRACWSTPIVSDEERVLGSFAVYYREPRRPDPLHRRVVDIAASVAAIAIQRAQAEETLRRGAARLKSVIDAAMDAVIGMDGGGRVISWNPRAEEIFGWSEREARGRRVSELIVPPDQVEAYERGLARFLETGESALLGRRIEMSALRRDRTPFPVEVSIVALRESGGLVFHAFVSDISEREQSARLLAFSEERFRQIAENIREVFWMTGADREPLIYVSPAYEAIWGRTCASAYADPRSFVDAILAEDRERVVRSMARQASGDYDEIYRILRPDGTVRWIHDRAFPVAGPGGEVVRVVGSAQDITELKRVEQALRDSEARYRTLFESAPDGIFVADADGRYVDVNPSGLRLLGYSREELLGLAIVDLVAPPDSAAVADAVSEIWHRREHQAEWRLRRKDGSFFDAEVLGSQTADGRLLGLVRDVSERKRMEEQLRQSQKMEAVGRLAGGIAHDFNNILGVITGYGEMLRRTMAADHPDRRRLDEIMRATERGGGLTRQLLAFSRKQVLAPKVVEPTTVVTEVRRLLEPLVGEDIELTVVTEARGRVRVDPGQLEQVLLNLVVNARDAMPMGGSLSIRTRDVDLDQEYIQRHEVPIQTGRYVSVSVADSGHGMDESTKARIFEPFFTTKPEGQGTGLGLATVYGIVKQSGGYIWAYSEVGLGTTFHVYLPRVEDEVSPNVARPERDHRIASETILVVEDEPAARELVAELLREEGYIVLLASNGQEAVDVAARTSAPLHLLLTDVILPKLSGRVAAERIRAIHPHIKILYMSGYTDDEVSRHGILEPGIVLLQKPFTPDELTRRVADVLEDREAETSSPEDAAGR